MNLINIRCPRCGHIRGEAANGSQVRLQCRQDKIKFMGVVRGEKFIHTGTIDLQRPQGAIGGRSSPNLIG